MFATLILNGAPLVCPPGGETVDLSTVVQFPQRQSSYLKASCCSRLFGVFTGVQLILPTVTGYFCNQKLSQPNTRLDNGPLLSTDTEKL